MVSSDLELLKSTNLSLSEDVAVIFNYAQAPIKRVSIHLIYNYFESDDMAVVPPKRCGNANCI